MTENKYQISGGGFVASNGFATLSQGLKPQLSAETPQAPKGKDIFKTPLSRYGRFDKYTRLGCAGIALAVRDAGLDELAVKTPVGIVLSTMYESYESDLAFQQTSLEENGAYSSPNLFSYTLPGIVLGEMAIHFKFTGPTFIVGDTGQNKEGFVALDAALDMLDSGVTDQVVAGWLESPPQEFNLENTQGSVFVVLSRQEKGKTFNSIIRANGKICLENGNEIMSVTDLF